MLKPPLQKIITEILTENFSGENIDGITLEDWKAIFAFSARHNIQVLIYTLLKRAKVDIPAEISESISKIYLAACGSDFIRRKQLKEIIRIFNENNIAHILLKGAHLINSVYRSPFTRLTADIDILVKDEVSAKAYKLLTENGYENFIASAEECETFKDSFNQHYPPLYKAGCLPVELHTCLSSIYKVNLEGIWNRSKKLNIDGFESRGMCNEDLIMHISMHKFMQDGATNGLLGLYDISSIINTDEIDWGSLKKLTGESEYNNIKCLYTALYLCETLLNVDISKDFLSSIKPESYTEETEEDAMELLFSDYSNFDKDAFALGEKMYDAKRDYSTIFRGVFINPYRLRLYGHNKYGKGDLGLFKLGFLFMKRAGILVRSYIGTCFALTLSGEKDNKSLQLGRKFAALKQWMKD